MSLNKLPLLALAASLCLTAPHLLEADEPAARTLVHAGVLIDGVSDSARREVTVVVEGDRIVDVTDAAAMDDLARLVTRELAPTRKVAPPRLTALVSYPRRTVAAPSPRPVSIVMAMPTLLT